MNHIDIHISWPANTYERIQVGSIHVNKPTLGMDDFRDSLDVRLEHSQRVRVGDHQRGDIFCHMLSQVVCIDCPFLIRFDFFDSIAAYMSARGICSVGGIWNQDNLSRIPSLFKTCPDEHHAQQLTLSSS